MNISYSFLGLNVVNTGFSIDFNTNYTLKTIADNSSYLVYNSTTVRKYSNTLKNMNLSYSFTGGTTIVDSFFGADNS